MLLVERVSSIFVGIAPLHEALDYHLERHNVLVSNLANLDTPGYRPKDVERIDNSFAKTLSVAMTATDPGHVQGAQDAGLTAGRVIEDPAEDSGNDNNTVSLDREAAKVASNQLRYDVVSALATSELGLLQYAASDGR